MRSVLLATLLVGVAITCIPSRALAQAAPCEALPQDGREYEAWSGLWGRHGEVMLITPNGCGLVTSRIYTGTLGERSATFALRERGDGWAKAPLLHGSLPETQIIAISQDDGTLIVDRYGEGVRFCRPWTWDLRCGA